MTELRKNLSAVDSMLVNVTVDDGFEGKDATRIVFERRHASAAGLIADGEAASEGRFTHADADREHLLETWNQTDWLIGGQD